MPDTLVSRLRAAGCVFAEREAELLREAATGAVLDDLTTRRVAGERLEDVLGWAEFAGRRYVIEPRVFVPRRRSEFLVDLASRHARPGDVVLDLCCGTGALSAAVSDRVPGLQVHAADLDPAAVRCARRNLPGAQVHLGDLFGPVPPRSRFDLVLANVPYVPSGEVGHLPAEMREHEARGALDGGPDGLDVARRVLDAAPVHLARGGRLFLELSEEQVEPARAHARSAGLDARALVEDETQTWVLSLTPSGGGHDTDR